MLKTIIVLPDGTELSSGVAGGNAVQSVTIKEMVNDSQELTLGSTCANMLEAKLHTPVGGLYIAAGDELTVYREADDGTRQKVGLFTTEKPTRPSANTMSITAYDRVSWLDKDLSAWLAGLSAWPYTLYALAEKVCAACGLTLANDTIPNGGFLIQAFSAEGLTGRQLMHWIGEVAGRFCRATADGLIEFAWYTPTDAEITPSGDSFYYQNSLTFEDYVTHSIEKVQLRLTDDDIGVIYPDVAEELNTYIITGNYLLTTSTTENLLPIARHLYETLQGVAYTPCKVSAFDCQGIRAGDIIRITDANGKTISTYVMTRTLTGQKVTLESTGSYRRDSSTAMNSLSLQALSGKMLELRQRVEGFSVTASEIKGKSIYDTVEEFYLSDDPTALSGGSWSTQQPQWTADKYIWRRYKVTKGDSSVTYTPSETGMCINNMIIGGRNLIRNSTNLQNEDYYFTSGKSTTEAEVKEKTVSGEVVTISDAATKAHDLQVKVSGVDDPTSVTVYRYGKNLYSHRATNIENATRIETFDNGAIVQGAAGSTPGESFWSNGWVNFDRTEDLRLKAGTIITVSLDYTVLEAHESAKDRIAMHLNGDTSHTGYSSRNIADLGIGVKTRISRTFAITADGNYYRLTVSLNSCKVRVENVQWEINDGVTDYEAYVEPQTATPNADGTVDGLTSLYPYMTLLTDAPGAVLDVSYHRMAALTEVSDTSPEGKMEAFARFAIEELPEAFVLPDIKVIGREYTLSFWLRSDAEGRLTINDATIPATTEWAKQAVTFTADSVDLSLLFNVAGTYYIYHPQLEEGNKATAWNLAPEDVEEAFREEMEQVQGTVEKNFADLTVQSDGIMAEVAKTQQNMEGIQEQITSMEQTANGLTLLIKEIQDNGVSKVTTETGYTFGADGLHISGAEGMENVLDEKGMVVSRSDEVVLQANEAGVIATDVKVRNYLIVGSHARFEDYTDGSDRKRTACFFIDGG